MKTQCWGGVIPFLVTWSLKEHHPFEPAALKSPRKHVEQILRFHPRPTESHTSRMGLRNLYVDEPFRWPLSDTQKKFEKQVNWCTYILSSLLVTDTQGLVRHPNSSGIEPTVYITTLCQGQASKNLGHQHQQKIFHMVLNSWQLSIMHEAQCYFLCSPLTCPTFATSESYTSWIATEAAFPELPLSTWVSLQFCAVNWALCLF